MRVFSFVLVFCMALGCLGVLARATAQADLASESANDLEARRAFEAGREAYDHGAFVAALAHFERAYELSKRTVLLFNIARAADADGQAGRARAAYEAYLQAFPTAENADFVRARIVKMQEIEAAKASTAPASASAQPAGQAAPPEAAATAASVESVATSAQPAAPAERVSTPVGLPTVAAAAPPESSPTSAMLAGEAPRSDDSGSSPTRRRRALIWTAVGVVVVGGIVGGALALTRDQEPERAEGDHYVVIREVPP